MISMVYQHETGVPLRIEKVATTELPFYRFIEVDPDTGFALATGTKPLVGVTIPEIDEYKRMNDGTIQKRNNKYFKNEIPRILRFGVCYIESDEEIKIGDLITIGEDGKGKKGDRTKDAIKGMALDDKNRDNVVRIALNFTI